MDGLLTNFIQNLKTLDWISIASVTIIGIILIIANAIIHYIKESISAKIRKSNEVRDILDSVSEPIKRKSDNLVSRLCNLLIGWADPEGILSIKRYFDDWDTFDKRLSSMGASDFSWVEVLAFRFLELFWAIQQFRIKTQKFINNPEVDVLDYFLVDKLPLAMRGKIYYLTYFTREEQEELEVFFHDEGLTLIEGPALRDLSKVLKNSEEKRKLFSKLVSYVCLEPRGFTDLCDGKYDTEDARQFCALAHFTIYLIDIYQRLAHSSKWEEYRVLLVKSLMRVNELRDTKVYLYCRHDINQGSYLLIYPEDLLERHFFTRWLTKAYFKPFSRKRKLAFYLALKARTRRYIYRHHRKRIISSGVVVRADKKDYNIDLADSLEGTKRQLLSYLEGSGRRMPYRLSDKTANKALHMPS